MTPQHPPVPQKPAHKSPSLEPRGAKIRETLAFGGIISLRTVFVCSTDACFIALHLFFSLSLSLPLSRHWGSHLNLNGKDNFWHFFVPGEAFG